MKLLLISSFIRVTGKFLIFERPKRLSRSSILHKISQSGTDIIMHFVIFKIYQHHFSLALVPNKLECSSGKLSRVLPAIQITKQKILVLYILILPAYLSFFSQYVETVKCANKKQQPINIIG